MAQVRPLSSLQPVSLRDSALLLDFDGTLAPIVEHPDEAQIAPGLIEVLALLQKATSGAVAVVSGRALSDLDTRLVPLRLAAAGSHGLEIRLPDGSIKTGAVADDALQGAIAAMREITGWDRRLLVEAKPASVALHYRQAPDLESSCIAAVERILRRYPQLHLLRGKMVLELKAGEGDKGAALETLMREPPFAGRRPIFAGDDVTDEHAFRVIERWNGIAIKVGPGETAATHRADDIGAFHRWLGELAAAEQPEGTAEAAQ